MTTDQHDKLKNVKAYLHPELLISRLELCGVQCIVKIPVVFSWISIRKLVVKMAEEQTVIDMQPTLEEEQGESSGYCHYCNFCMICVHTLDRDPCPDCNCEECPDCSGLDCGGLDCCQIMWISSHPSHSRISICAKNVICQQNHSSNVEIHFYYDSSFVIWDSFQRTTYLILVST